MPFFNYACHVWAIDGYENGERAKAVNSAYEDEAGLRYGRPLRDKDQRVKNLIKAVRGRCRPLLTHHRAIFFGGWERNSDSAPAHMWLVYHNFIYDTVPEGWLRRKRAYLHNLNFPPSEGIPFDSSMVGSCICQLTQSQYRIIQNAQTAVWRARDGYESCKPHG